MIADHCDPGSHAGRSLLLFALLGKTRELLFVLLSKPRDRDGPVITLNIDQLYALCGAADRANGFRCHSEDLALLRDQHQLIIVGHLSHADHLAVPFRGLDVDDPDTTARLDTIFIQAGALAVALLGHAEDRAARRQDIHADDLVALTQRDTADAARGASHRANVGLGEPNRHAIPGADEDLVSPIGDLHRDDSVAVFDVHRDDAAGARVAERGQFSLLHLTALGPHHDELVLFELPDGEQRGDSFAFLHRDQVRDRFSPAVR